MKKYSARFFLRIISICSVAVFALGVLIYGFSTQFGIPDLLKKSDDTAREMPYVYEEEVKTLREIEVDWANGPITLNFHSGDLIQITETAKKEISEDEKLYLEVSGGKLSVKWNSSRLQLGVSREDAKQLELLIPEKFFETLESVQINSVSGDIGIDGLTAEETNFESVSGELHLSNITAERLTAETVSGDIFCRTVTAAEEISVTSNSGNIELTGMASSRTELDNTSGETAAEGTANTLECVSVSGDIKLDMQSWPVETVLENVSGNTEFFAPNAKDGFICNVSTVSGDFDCGFEVQKKGNLYQCGAGVNSIEITSTSGDIELHEKVG